MYILIISFINIIFSFFPTFFLLVEWQNGSFRPHLPVSFVEKELAFEDTAGCVAFLTESGVTMSLDQANIDCKQSMTVL